MGNNMCSQFVSEILTTGLTSTNAGVASTVDTRFYRNGYIGIANTGATNTVQYKIESYMDMDGTIVITEQAYADIAPAAQVVFKIDDAPRAKHVITVKSKVGGSHSAYKIEYCLGL
jgi:D-arabinose 5-phosphate isomerase GutQ